MAVKPEGARRELPPGHPIREKITARLGKKASFGRKIRGGSLDSRENYGQNGPKICPFSKKFEKRVEIFLFHVIIIT